MNVGFDAKRAFHNNRGLGSYSRNLIEGLNFYYPQNKYFLYTPDPKEEKAHWARKYSKSVIRCPQNLFLKKIHPLWRSFFLCKDLNRDDLDIYHGLSGELPFGIDKLKTKKIITIHDLLFMKHPHLFSALDRVVFLKKAHYSTDTADLIIATSEQTKKDIMKYLSISQERITVVYQSCHERFYTPCSREKLDFTRKQYHLPEKYILYVGAIEENKNTFSLVKAFSALKEENISLVLAGKGKSYRDMIISEVGRLNIEKRVHFLEDIPDDDLPGLYQNARFFIYPSFYEGLGIPIIEALFSGKAVITSKSSSMPEAAGEGAIYVDPHDTRELKEAMDKLITDRTLRNSLMHKGRHHVEKFHRHKAAKKIMSIYENLVENIP